ncbi:hypothetical protein ABT224_03555 [Streptomyces sp. NPDC001584]|uniref:hypothetical protein n=1 Tax=Streptomyces sp. NPDC001584 TaxID=3154521 RepID=UPI00332A80EB
MSQLTHQLPNILLPASSDLPVDIKQKDAGAAAFSEEFRKLHGLLGDKEQLPDVDSIRVELTHAASSLYGMAETAAAQTTSAQTMSKEDLSRNLREALGDIDRERRRLDDFVIYDKYFGVARSASYTRDDFAANLTKTVARLLDDLTHTLLNIDDLAAIVRSADVMLRSCCAGDGDTSLESAPLVATANVPSHAHPRETDTAYRWRLGHHFFALCAEFSRHCLIAAANRLPDGSPHEMADLIDLARLTLRGTTAAMWYATNMSQAAYMGTIRPSMEAVQIGGFSGTQNLDYERLKKTRESTIKKFCQRYGTKDDFQFEVREAFVAHCEAEVQDLEHHTLIAASKVSMNPSLLQGSGAAFPAVEMLRLMAHGRRGDLAIFLGSVE